MHRLILILMVISCGSGKNRPGRTTTPLEAVQKKRDVYMQLARDQRDSYGWLAPRCDGLLFNSLAAYSGFVVDLFQAELSPGEWERHPSRCFRNGSKSSISKDMFRGLFIYLLSQNDTAALRRIKDFCDAHPILLGTSCAMGQAVDEESYFGRVVFNPAQRYELERMIDSSLKEDPAEEVGLKTDFEAHLDVLRIYTELHIDGGLSNAEVSKLHAYADKYPGNALFQILSSKFREIETEKILDILLDETLFPSDRLPNEHDRYTHYVWQRDPGPDWAPCVKTDDLNHPRRCIGTTHPGIDLILAVKLLEE